MFDLSNTTCPNKDFKTKPKDKLIEKKLLCIVTHFVNDGISCANEPIML